MAVCVQGGSGAVANSWPECGAAAGVASLANAVTGL